MPDHHILDIYDEIGEPSPSPVEKRRKFDQATRAPAILRTPNDQRVQGNRIAPFDAADASCAYALMEGVPATVRDALGEQGLKVLRRYLLDSDMEYSYFSKYFADMARKDYDNARIFLEPGLRAWTAPVLSAIAPGSNAPSIKK